MNCHLNHSTDALTYLVFLCLPFPIYENRSCIFCEFFFFFFFLLKKKQLCLFLHATSISCVRFSGIVVVEREGCGYRTKGEGHFGSVTEINFSREVSSLVIWWHQALNSSWTETLHSLWDTAPLSFVVQNTLNVGFSYFGGYINYPDFPVDLGP